MACTQFYRASWFFRDQRRANEKGFYGARMQVSPDGQRAALLGSHRNICIFPVDGGEKICELWRPSKYGEWCQTMRYMYAAHWLTDNTILAVGPGLENYGCEDGIVFDFWDVALNERTNNIYIPIKHHGYDSPGIYSAAFSPDHVAVGTNDDKAILVLNIQNNAHFLLRDSGTGDITCLAWSPDGTRLAAGGYCGRIVVWNLSDKRLVFSLNEHRHKVNALAWLSCGGKLAAGSWCEQYIRVWDVSTEFHDTPKNHYEVINEKPWDPQSLSHVVKEYPASYGFEDPLPPCLVQMIPAQRGFHLSLLKMEISHCRTKIAYVYWDEFMYFYNFNTKTTYTIRQPFCNSQPGANFCCATVTCISWFPDNTHILISDDNGNVLKVNAGV